MKAQILTTGLDDLEYVDYYFNESDITGWYITSENVKDQSVNVTFQGDTFTFLQQKHITDYLFNNFTE